MDDGEADGEIVGDAYCDEDELEMKMNNPSDRMVTSMMIALIALLTVVMIMMVMIVMLKLRNV